MRNETPDRRVKDAAPNAKPSRQTARRPGSCPLPKAGRSCGGPSPAGEERPAERHGRAGEEAGRTSNGRGRKADVGPAPAGPHQRLPETAAPRGRARRPLRSRRHRRTRAVDHRRLQDALISRRPAAVRHFQRAVRPGPHAPLSGRTPRHPPRGGRRRWRTASRSPSYWRPPVRHRAADPWPPSAVAAFSHPGPALPPARGPPSSPPGAWRGRSRSPSVSPGQPGRPATRRPPSPIDDHRSSSIRCNSRAARGGATSLR